MLVTWTSLCNYVQIKCFETKCRLTTFWKCHSFKIWCNRTKCLLLVYLQSVRLSLVLQCVQKYIRNTNQLCSRFIWSFYLVVLSGRFIWSFYLLFLHYTCLFTYINTYIPRYSKLQYKMIVVCHNSVDFVMFCWNKLGHSFFHIGIS